MTNYQCLLIPREHFFRFQQEILTKLRYALIVLICTENIDNLCLGLTANFNNIKACSV